MSSTILRPIRAPGAASSRVSLAVLTRWITPSVSTTNTASVMDATIRSENARALSMARSCEARMAA